LAVEGVTSISADIHKLGYAPKGVSVLLHRSKALRRYQTFDFDGWLGGRYVTPNLQGTRSGLPMAARGWGHDRQGPPDGLHLTVSAGNAPIVERWLSDLAGAVDDVRSSAGSAPVNPATGAYSTLE
jgi:hypothetical protein